MLVAPAILSCLLCAQLAAPDGSPVAAEPAPSIGFPSIDAEPPNVPTGEPGEQGLAGQSGEANGLEADGVPPNLLQPAADLPSRLPAVTLSPQLPFDSPADDTSPTATPPPDAEPVLPAVETPPPPSQSEMAEKTPPQRVAEMLAVAPDGPLAGRPLTLAEAIASVDGHAARLDATHAYWRLAQATGQYRSILDAYELVDAMEGLPQEETALPSARASALADLQRAELDLLTAQLDLAARVFVSPASALPQAVDLPHVGAYRTHFDEVFSNRAVPPKARLVDRTLPITRRLIDVRARAVESAEDALAAAVRAYNLGQGDVSEVLACTARWRRRRSDLIVSVCRYNHDIAEYALAVTTADIDPRELVAMLITNGQGATGPMAPQRGPAEAGSEVQQATLTEPIVASLPSRRTPTLAPPRESIELSRNDDAAPGEALPPIDTPQTASPGAAPETTSAEYSILERSAAPFVPPAPESAARVVQRPIDDREVPPTSAELYPGLSDKRVPVQAKQLAAALYSRRPLSDTPGETITLRQCLGRVPAAHRKEGIEQFWAVSQRAAEARTLAAQASFLEALALIDTSPNSAEDSPLETALLRGARATAEAELLRARRQLVESQFEFTQTLGLPSDSLALLPATTPHSGPYLLRLEAQPRRVVESWSMRQLAMTIPRLGEGVERDAAAVVQADLHRAAVTRSYRSGDQSLDQVLAAVSAQTEQTLAFLKTLGTYNRSIADYVLSVLPTTVSEDQLVGTLVVQ